MLEGHPGTNVEFLVEVLSVVSPNCSCCFAGAGPDRASVSNGLFQKLLQSLHSTSKEGKKKRKCLLKSTLMLKAI